METFSCGSFSFWRDTEQPILSVSENRGSEGINDLDLAVAPLLLIHVMFPSNEAPASGFFARGQLSLTGRSPPPNYTAIANGPFGFERVTVTVEIRRIAASMDVKGPLRNLNPLASRENESETFVEIMSLFIIN